MPFNTGSLTPETFIGLGTGLLSGGTWNEQLANAGTGAINAMNAQKEKQTRDLQLKTTAQFLQDKDPQLAAMVMNGAMQPADAYKQFLTTQAEKEKRSQPDYMSVDGMIFDKTSKQWMAPPSNLRQTKPTAEYQDYQLQQSDPNYAKFKKSELDAKNAPNTQDQFKTTIDTMKTYRSEDAVKTYTMTRDAYEKVRTNATLGTAQGDIGLVYGFMKMLDPTSVVREGEYATAQNSGGISDTVMNLYNKVLSGERLTEDQRKQFVEAAGAQYENTVKNLQTVNDRYSDLANEYGVKTDRVLEAPKTYPALKLGEKMQTTVGGKPATIERVSE